MSYYYVCTYTVSYTNCNLHVIQIEDENFIHLHINGNASLGNKNTLRLVILVNDDLKSTSNHPSSELSGIYATLKFLLVC